MRWSPARYLHFISRLCSAAHCTATTAFISDGKMMHQFVAGANIYAENCSSLRAKRMTDCLGTIHSDWHGDCSTMNETVLMRTVAPVTRLWFLRYDQRNQSV